MACPNIPEARDLAVARRDYPDAVLVFMDVDCSIRGDISGIVETRGMLRYASRDGRSAAVVR